MPPPVTIAEAFRLLQAGDAAAALEASRALIAREPRNGRAHLAAGLALRMLGQLEESAAAIEAAASLAPDDFGAAYEKGVAHELRGQATEARECFARAARLKPGFAPAHYALGMSAFARGEWAAAIASLEMAATLDPRNPDAPVNLGLALAESGAGARAIETLAGAVQRFDARPAARHALGWALHKSRRAAEAVPHLAAALAARNDPGWRIDLAKALADAGRFAEAREHFETALAEAPASPAAMLALGRFCVRQGDFARAAEAFHQAWTAAPGHEDLPMYIAQVELLRGRWREGWRAYARRPPRLRHEALARERGEPYRVPDAAQLPGAHLLVTGEQGLGDELFMLRFAPALRAAGTRLSYQGEPRLRALLEPTALFEQVLAFGEPAPAGSIAVLSGDLPLLAAGDATPVSLAIAPDPERLEAMRRRLERAGPRPWIGVTWRAGTAPADVPEALHKVAPVAGLFAALPRDGTVVSLQRAGGFEELESASRALGRPIHDFSAANTDLRDALALVALLDRHVGVSNTNMHLAAAAGATADVLVPFPPEWRWGIEGESPWFPGFRLFRQQPGGDWSRALAELASAGPGSRSRA